MFYPERNKFYVPPCKFMHVIAVKGRKWISDVQPAFSLASFTPHNFLDFDLYFLLATLLFFSLYYLTHLSLYIGVLPGNTFASTGLIRVQLCMSDIFII